MHQMMCAWVGVTFWEQRTGSPFSPQERNGAVDLVPLILIRYDYKIAREYNWNVKNKASKGYEENYFFIFREGDGVYYNELETRYLVHYHLRLAWACALEP